MSAVIQVGISFESLITAIKSLDLSKKRELLEILEDQIFEAAEELEEASETLAELEEARQAYQKGDYQTIQDYMATRPKRTLEEVMSEISRNAQQRGLTPEILESILNDP